MWIPKIHYVVFMVPSIQMKMVGVDNKKCKQDDKYFCGIFPSVNKVTIENVGIFF